MPKGPLITPEIEALIASVYRKHPDWKAPKIRNEVESIVFQNKLGFPRGWPGLSAVQKVLAVARKPQPPPGPWSLASLDNEDSQSMTPEELRAVFELYERCMKLGRSFSTRDAKWAARLSAFIEDVEELNREVDRYSVAEDIFESIGRPFNSRWLDCNLMGLSLPRECSEVDEAVSEYQKGVDEDQAMLAECFVFDL